VPPRATVPPKGTKAAGDWAVHIGAAAGKISALLLYSADGSGVGNLDRDFSVQIQAAGNTFGIRLISLYIGVSVYYIRI
jgi:hypothetical protein